MGMSGGRGTVEGGRGLPIPRLGWGVGGRGEGEQGNGRRGEEIAQYTYSSPGLVESMREGVDI